MRDLTAEMVAELSSNNIHPILLAQLEFDSETLYMWSGTGTLTWAGNDYMGGGNLITVSPMEETQDIEAKGIICTLNGIPATLIAVALLERTRGRPFRMWLGAIDADTTTDYRLLESGDIRLLESGDIRLLESSVDIAPNTLIVEPYRMFTGLMDIMELNDDGETATIRLSVESSQILNRRTRISHYTSEEQKKTYPDDLGLDFINQLQDKEVVW